MKEENSNKNQKSGQNQKEKGSNNILEVPSEKKKSLPKSNKGKNEKKSRNAEDSQSQLSHELSSRSRASHFNKKVSATKANISHKMPDSVKEILRATFFTNQLISSSLGNIIKSKLRLIKICQSCYQQILEDNTIWLTDCEHKHTFCQSCLHHYAIYKIQKFEDVYCLHEGCQAPMSIQSACFLDLPTEIQVKYKKIHQFYQTQEDPSLRLCPKHQCEGVIKLSEENSAVCSTCSTVFCKKCFFQIHQGTCDEHEVSFFQENLHYRQCKKCKMVIEKNQGCNHITCKCKHQFCYICGKDWRHGHLCNEAVVQVPPQPIRIPAPAAVRPQRHPCLKALICPLKSILVLLWLTLMLIALPFVLISLVPFFLVGLVVGGFGYSCALAAKFNRQYEAAFKLFSICIFPFLIIGGMIIGLSQIMSWPLRRILAKFCIFIGDGLAVIIDC